MSAVRSQIQPSLKFPIRKTRSESKGDSIRMYRETRLPANILLKTPQKHQIDENPTSSGSDSFKKSPCSPPKKLKYDRFVLDESSCDALTARTPEKLTSGKRNTYSPKKRSPLNKENGVFPNNSPRKCPPGYGGHGINPSIEKKFAPVRLFTPELSIYQEAKGAFLTGSTSILCCRDTELKAITSFLESHLIKNSPGSLYISGAPGTGKTACLNQILRTVKFQNIKHTCLSINCTNLKSPQSIYERICFELCSKNEVPKKNTTADFQKCIQRKLTNSSTTILLILDEIDYLESKDQAILYTIFEWPVLKNSKFILIGIANALDLTDRTLPRLQVQPLCKPKLLHFTPYTKDQIVTILQERLKEVSKEAQNLVKPAAVQFCARKVASVTGDIRKALDVCRHAIELVEGEMRKQQILQPRTLRDEIKPKTVKCVDLPLIVSILNEVYGNQLSNVGQNENVLPLQQKIMLCALFLITTNGKAKEVTLGKFHEVYSRICKKQQVTQLDQSEFTNICNLVEARGLMCIRKNKTNRLSKVSLTMNESELEFALHDKCLLASILSDSSCLSPMI